MLETLGEIFTITNFLLATPLLFTIVALIFLGMAQPIAVVMDCVHNQHLSLMRKVLWLAAMVFSFGIATFIYPWVVPGGTVMKVADRVMLAPLWILLVVYFLLYLFHDGVRGFFNHQTMNLLSWVKELIF